MVELYLIKYPIEICKEIGCFYCQIKGSNYCEFHFKILLSQQEKNHSKMEYKTHQKAILITSMEILRITTEKMGINSVHTDVIEWSNFQKNLEIVKKGLDLVLTELFDEIQTQKKEILS